MPTPQLSKTQQASALKMPPLNMKALPAPQAAQIRPTPEEHGAVLHMSLEAEMLAMVSHMKELYKSQKTLSAQLQELALGQSVMSSVLSKIHERLVLDPRECIPSADYVSAIPANDAKKDDLARIGGVKDEVEAAHKINVANAGAQVAPVSLLQTNAEVRRNDALEELNGLVAVHHEVHKKQVMETELRQKATCLERLGMLKNRTKALIDDAMGCIIIIANSIFIGISAQYWDGSVNALFVIDAGFAIIFACEFAFRLRLHGIVGSFCGEHRVLNFFDAFLCTMDTFQLLLVVISRDTSDALQEKGVPSASLFRTVRLVRVSRILRLLRHPYFRDMLTMLEGTLAGIRTLAVAMVMFAAMVYCVALMCKEMFGQNSDYEDVYPYFNGVARSMYTVFRCSFGDCSTGHGTPLPETLHESYGWVSSIFYASFTFFVTIGFFNVVSAVFVDSTLQWALQENTRKFQSRLADHELWATHVCTIVRRCLLKTGHIGQHMDPLHASMFTAELPRSVVDDICQNDEVAMRSLDELDIDPDDHRRLVDILDPDHSGTVSFTELLKGLQNLRGQPRRSDIVVVDLMVRAVQEKLDDILLIVMENASSCEVLKEALEIRRLSIEGRLKSKMAA